MIVINASVNEEIKVKAQLHGMKLKPTTEALNMSKEERKEADALALKTLNKLKTLHKLGIRPNGRRTNNTDKCIR